MGSYTFSNGLRYDRDLPTHICACEGPGPIAQACLRSSRHRACDPFVPCGLPARHPNLLQHPHMD
eukprot:10417525-Alexandrium_andersonii.AAC.1